MDSPGAGVDLKAIVLILRRVTTAVQILPFVYSALYIITLCTYSLAGEETQAIIDSLFYVSPICIISFLILSKVLKLCRWHKTACLLPMIPMIVSFLDYHLISLTEIESYVFNGTVIIMSILLLVAAYNVFFK